MGKTIPFSESSPIVIGKLSLYPSRLEYRDVRCNLQDVEHLGWYWMSQTINLVNTQHAELKIFLRGRTKPIRISKKTMYVQPKIVTAYNYIAKKTFQNRLGFYTDQLEKSGGFTYDNCYFYSDGRVVSDGKTFDLAKATIEPFSMSIKEKGLFSSKAKIKLAIDRDIVLSLFDYILKNPTDPSVYVENHSRQSTAAGYNQFIRDVVSLMASLSSADGRVSPEEINVVKGFLADTLKLDREEFAKAVAIFNQAKHSPNIFEFSAESLAAYSGDNPELLTSVVDLLFSIAIADGVLSAEEELLIKEAESIFGVRSDQFNRFQQQTRNFTSSKEEHFLNVLGLSLGAEEDDIRQEYKRLVMKFHPDRVHHLGEEFVAQAEIKMKEINEAYKFLCR